MLAGFALNGAFRTAHAPDIVADLVRVLPSELAQYRDSLLPLQRHLTAPLAEIYGDESASEQVRAFATDTLANYLNEDAAGLFDLLASANQQQFAPMFDRLQTAHRNRAVELATVEVARRAPARRIKKN